MLNWQHFPSFNVLLLAAAFFVPLGCTHTVEYKPNYFGTPALNPSGRINAKCIIHTTSGDDSYVFRGPPSSALGAAEILKIPLGLITKNAAIRVFGAACSEVSAVDNLDGKTYDIAIYPKPIGFLFLYNDSRNLGLFITPQVVIDLQITALNSKQEVIFSRAYSSGLVNGKNIYIPMTGRDNVNGVTHKTILNLLYAAAVDLMPLITSNVESRKAGTKFPPFIRAGAEQDTFQ